MRYEKCNSLLKCYYPLSLAWVGGGAVRNQTSRFSNLQLLSVVAYQRGGRRFIAHAAFSGYQLAAGGAALNANQDGRGDVT